MLTSLARSYGLGPDSVRLAVRIEPIALEIDTALPCGLIINELVSNALKHAFPEGRDGEVRVELHDEGSSLRLCVADTGIGLPAEIDWRQTRSLGLQLVGMLVQQLSGSIEVRREGGTEFNIRFPPAPEPAA